jgi:hypothetical protein
LQIEGAAWVLAHRLRRKSIQFPRTPCPLDRTSPVPRSVRLQ